MSEAVFAIVGIVLGASLAWLQTAYVDRLRARREDRAHRRRLAARVLAAATKTVAPFLDLGEPRGVHEAQRRSEAFIDETADAVAELQAFCPSPVIDSKARELAQLVDEIRRRAFAWRGSDPESPFGDLISQWRTARLEFLKAVDEFDDKGTRT